LQSSLTRVLSSALGFSPHPPVSVYGTARCCLKLRGFSREQGINHFGPRGTSSSRLRINEPPDFPGDSPYTLKPGNPIPAGLAFSVTPSQQHLVQEC